MTRVRQLPRDPHSHPGPPRRQAHLFLTLRCEAGKLSLGLVSGVWGPVWQPLMPPGDARPSAGWAFADWCRDVDPGGCQHPCDVLSVGTNPRSCGRIPGLCHFRRCRGRGARCSPTGLRGSSRRCWGPPGRTTQACAGTGSGGSGSGNLVCQPPGLHVLWGSWGAPVQSPHVGPAVSLVVCLRG